MKKLLQNLLLLFSIFTLSCKKGDIETLPISSLKVINVIVGGTPARLGTQTITINNNAAAQFTLPTGTSRLYIFPTTDSLHPYYNEEITTDNGEIYSLFLGGEAAGIEAVVVKDALPSYTDSSFGVRFMNFSPGSPAVKVTLSASPANVEAGALEYKQVSDFKTYAALSTNTTYTFQFRNAETDAIIASVTMTGTNIPRYKNVTLVLRGVVGGAPAAGVTRVNDY
jgi:hypothetical protein